MVFDNHLLEADRSGSESSASGEKIVSRTVARNGGSILLAHSCTASRIDVASCVSDDGSRSFDAARLRGNVTIQEKGSKGINLYGWVIASPSQR